MKSDKEIFNEILEPFGPIKVRPVEVQAEPPELGVKLDGAGLVSHVDGDGVVGEQPVLMPGQSHDYVSGCPLDTPHGSMEGFYTFRGEDGSPLEVRIPYFPLAAPATAD